MLSSAAGQASKRSNTIGPSSAGEQPISTAAPNTRIVSAPSVRSVWSTATSVTASSTHISSRSETP